MIRFEDVTKRYPAAGTDAVNHLNLQIDDGEICMLVGSSGCGKTTTMKMINKLIQPTSGRILIDGQDIETLDTIELRLNTGYIIQDIGLFPHMTVADNIATVPNELGWDKNRIRQRVDELLELVDLDPAQYRQKKPRELSGGQKQRVGVARALAADPRIMLMDEPFGALDPITRAKLQDEFLKIQEKIRKTIVFVTHDIDEAIKMGDKIAVMKAGSMIQLGTPMEILTRPADRFVSELIGGHSALKTMNLILCREIMEPFDAAGEQGLAAANMLPGKATAQEAMSEMLRTGQPRLLIGEDKQQIIGVITLEKLFQKVSQYGEAKA